MTYRGTCVTAVSRRRRRSTGRPATGSRFFLVESVEARAAAGNAAFAGHLEAGHHIHYLADAEYVDRQRDVFERCLLANRSRE
ncbi:hypothetical protein [Sinosporangium album]|nr:hypothetical protein [Sinosporangium album]